MKTLLMCAAVLILAQALAAETRQASPAASTTIEQIRDRVDRSANIPEFVRWLEGQATVSEVDYNSTLFFTTDPSQQFVSFTLDGQHYRFLLRGGGTARVTLTREEGPR